MLFERKGLRVSCAVLASLCLAAAGCTSAGDVGTTTQATVTSAGEMDIACSSEQVGAEVDDIVDWITDSVYDEDNSAAIAAGLDAQKSGQTLAEPLVEYNPFGTNSLSLYVYFVTDEDASVSYTVSVADEDVATIEDESLTETSIADFTREVDDGATGTEHEFQVIGLIGGIENTVTLTATYASGDAETCTITADMCERLGDEELQLEVEEGTSDAELEDGLYVVLGNDDEDVDFMYYYDNDGILRGEVPIIGYRSHRILFDDDLMYYSIGYHKLAAVDALGQVQRVYDLGDYALHHDYVFGEEGTMLVLGTDDAQDETVEDLVLSLDLETGDVSVAVDMGDLFESFKESSIAYHEQYAESDRYDGGVDWMHLNTVQYLADDDAIIVSSRETSSIIKVENLSTTPTIGYLLSSKEYWEGTEYESYVYDKVGDFTVQGGQHAVTYVEDDSLEEGQYYLMLFNNNMGVSHDTTTDFDFSSIGITESTGLSDNEDAVSYYYKYLVDENAGTFELVDSFEVPYSGYVSSVQQLASNMVVDSGNPGIFAEYDENHELIRSFTMKVDYLFVYRVFKYDL